MDHLSDLESKSLSIIREAKAQFKNMGVLWSTGKDSTATLWLCKKAFFGKIPFPVIHLDTGQKFPEIYAFRDKIAKEWELDLIVARNEEALRNFVLPRIVKESMNPTIMKSITKWLSTKDKHI